MKKTTFKKIFIWLIALIIVTGSISYVGMRYWFKSDIDKIREQAMTQFEGDKIEALVAVLNSETNSLNEKNKAIWALGKLNDERALPALKKLQTHEECNHSNSVCQRELKKAIDNLEGKSIDLFTFK